MVTPHVRLGPRFAEAVAWVSDLHAEQPRKGGGDVPYVSHLLAVVALVLEDGGDEDDAVIALCHDAVEDQGGAATLAEIRRRFGAVVADAVGLLSEPDGDADRPWAERKRTLLAQLGAAEVPERVLRVAAADKLHNVRSLLVELRREGPRAWEHRRARPADHLWFYRSVSDLLAERHPGSVSGAELERAVAELADWLPEAHVSLPA